MDESPTKELRKNKKGKKDRSPSPRLKKGKGKEREPDPEESAEAQTSKRGRPVGRAQTPGPPSRSASSDRPLRSHSISRYDRTL